MLSPSNIQVMLKQMKLTGQDFEGTPERVSRMWQEFLNPPKLLVSNHPLVQRGGMILLRNHETYGFCPHHLLPVKYNITFGYLPKHKRVIGASKPLRAVALVLSKLPLQEDVAPLLLNELIDLDPMGMGVLVKGEHMCMRMRGVRSACSDMVTDCMQGLFLYSSEVRQEFLTLCKI